MTTLFGSIARCGKFRRIAALATMLASGTGLAGLSPYSEDFESYAEAAPEQLLGGGWLVYGNAFGSGGGYLYGYGPFAAPNSGGGFCNVATGEGGPDQGTKVLTVYSDYNNAGMASPTSQLIEANVFQEYTIAASDVGATWTFQFDVKKGNLGLRSTNIAFIKVLNPFNGYSTTTFKTFDVATLADANWATQSLQTTIGEWQGQILQIGFMATATEYEGSGAFYDNLSFTSPDYVAPPGPRIVSAGFEGSNYQITFETKFGFQYSLWKAETPAGPYEVIDTGLFGDDSEATLYDYEATGDKAFYRVGETPNP